MALSVGIPSTHTLNTDCKIDYRYTFARSVGLDGQRCLGNACTKDSVVNFMISGTLSASSLEPKCNPATNKMGCEGR